MAKALDFTKVKKEYLPVTFPDGKNILVGTPTKAIFNSLEFLDSDEGENENIDGLYEACALVMSRNKTGAVISKEYIESVFDLQDVITFFSAYKAFLVEVLNGKN